jgi:ADP-ribose pyrophosphatase YjhB (NUDIX family)
LSVRLAEARFSVTVGGVIRDNEGRVLLLEHAFRAGSAWGIPGGFVNPREQPEAALRRELREEVGLELETVELAFVRTLTTVDQLEIVFTARARGDARPRDAEIKSLQWFAPDALPAELPRGQRDLIAQALARPRSERH